MRCGSSAWRRAASTATAARRWSSRRPVSRGSDAGRRGRSSQFPVALLQVAPYARHDVRLDIDGPLVSAPYVDMTLALMGRSASRSSATARASASPLAQRYRAGQLRSSPTLRAPLFLGRRGSCSAERWCVHGLGRDSLQGDVRFVDVLAAMGAEVRFEPERVIVSRQQGFAASTPISTAISDTSPPRRRSLRSPRRRSHPQHRSYARVRRATASPPWRPSCGASACASTSQPMSSRSSRPRCTAAKSRPTTITASR